LDVRESNLFAQFDLCSFFHAYFDVTSFGIKVLQKHIISFGISDKRYCLIFNLSDALSRDLSANKSLLNSDERMRNIVFIRGK